ncbi:hypothetical protein ABGB17_18015 [Sphaerisporangium sp. B11E5]|uniref:hypothetical protein n=1 Tax=Sphaerisporangium sp. B11E5 TaxID=3153563 RepID=UPI00325E23BE
MVKALATRMLTAMVAGGAGRTWGVIVLMVVLSAAAVVTGTGGVPMGISWT